MTSGESGGPEGQSTNSSMDQAKLPDGHMEASDEMSQKTEAQIQRDRDPPSKEACEAACKNFAKLLRSDVYDQIGGEENTNKKSFSENDDWLSLFQVIGRKALKTTIDPLIGFAGDQCVNTCLRGKELQERGREFTVATGDYIVKAGEWSADVARCIADANSMADVDKCVPHQQYKKAVRKQKLQEKIDRLQRELEDLERER